VETANGFAVVPDDPHPGFVSDGVGVHHCAYLSLMASGSRPWALQHAAKSIHVLGDGLEM
jgi:hypothetical protein